MARCDEGYRCEVCQQDVEDILVSDLYLRYILGEVGLERLHLLPERHIRCNPTLSQYIVDNRFEPVVVDSLFGKAHLDADYVRMREEQVTQAWQRLQAIPRLRLSLAEYPLAMTPFSDQEIET